MKLLKVKDIDDGRKCIAYINPKYITSIVEGENLSTPTDVYGMKTTIFCLPHNYYGSDRDIEDIRADIENGER